jgi:ABC-type Zn uptake system ZnuABC Zn-binding protein ZnuA
MFRRIRSLLLIAVIPAFWSGAPAWAQEIVEPLRVVTTFSILDDLVRNVGGEAITTHSLAGAGIDSHTYEPVPNDVAVLADADLIIANGLDFEPWLDELVAAAGTAAPLVIVSEGVPLLRMGQEAGADGTAEPGQPAEDGHGEHAPGEFDPHIWHDASNAVIMVEAIRDALVAADPANAATYEANAAAYITELEALDAWVMEQVATLPDDQRKLVTSHESLAYYANRYGFELVGTAFGTLSTEAGDPSAADIAELVAAIQAQGVNAIFAENTSNPDLMAAIAAEAGVTLAPTLYTDALGGPGSGAETYIDLIRANTTEIVTALSGE